MTEASRLTLDVYGSLTILPRPEPLTVRFAFRSLRSIVHYMDDEAWRQEPTECGWIIPLDLGERVMYERPVLVSVGSTNTIVLDPMSIFRVALAAQAENIILLHNHPSGRGIISDADRRATRRLKKAGEILRIPLLVHVILATERCRAIHHPKLDRVYAEQQKRRAKKTACRISSPSRKRGDRNGADGSAEKTYEACDGCGARWWLNQQCVCT